MNFLLILFGAICAVFIVLRIVRRVSEKGARTDASVPLQTSRSQNHAHARIVWAEPLHILRLIHSGADLVIFRLIKDEGMRRGPAVFRGEIAATLEEFEATVPWIPTISRIVVHHCAGIDAAVARQIAAHCHGRDLMLLAGMVPEPLEGGLEVAGDVRSG